MGVHVRYPQPPQTPPPRRAGPDRDRIAAPEAAPRNRPAATPREPVTDAQRRPAPRSTATPTRRRVDTTQVALETHAPSRYSDVRAIAGGRRRRLRPHGDRKGAGGT